jgi:hypothetical protein
MSSLFTFLEQELQTTIPQERQWCFRRKNENSLKQTRQLLACSFGIQTGASKSWIGIILGGFSAGQRIKKTFS